MNRITERFKKLKGANKKGFVVYIGAGDPNLVLPKLWRSPSIKSEWTCLKLAYRSVIPWRMDWSTSSLRSGASNQEPHQKKYWKRSSLSGEVPKSQLSSTFISTFCIAVVSVNSSLMSRLRSGWTSCPGFAPGRI